MKQAEEWMDEMFGHNNWVVADTVTLRAVQLEAVRHGMTLAAEHLHGVRGGDRATLEFCEQHIRQLRDRLSAEELKPKPTT